MAPQEASVRKVWARSLVRTRSRGEATAGAALAGRDNAIGLIRLVAASLVVATHAAGGATPLWLATSSQIGEGQLAVDVFFILSGYLITASWFRLGSLPRFAWHRTLRIYPAYLVCIAAIGVVAGWEWFSRNLPLVTGIYRVSLNGALWTLPIELWCYAGVAVLGALRILRWQVVALLGAAMWIGFGAWVATHPGLEALTTPMRLGTFFAAGSLAWFARGRLPIDWRIAVGSSVVLAVATIAGDVLTPRPAGLLLVAAPLPLTYLMLYLAARLPGRWINGSWDISYGTYIYGSPVIAVLRWAGIAGAALVPIALAATWVVGAASWRYVERPALGLKDWRRSSSSLRDAEVGRRAGVGVDLPGSAGVAGADRVGVRAS